MTEPAGKILPTLRVVSNGGGQRGQKASAEAQIAPKAILAAFDCERSHRDCYDCRRRFAA